MSFFNFFCLIFIRSSWRKFWKQEDSEIFKKSSTFRSSVNIALLNVKGYCREWVKTGINSAESFFVRMHFPNEQFTCEKKKTLTNKQADSTSVMTYIYQPCSEFDLLTYYFLRWVMICSWYNSLSNPLSRLVDWSIWRVGNFSILIWKKA